jgi:hypothetical protein
MAPWRLSNRYDRPIPRRLAEEAGVPRELFGQVKVGSTVEFVPPQIPQDPVLRAEYFEFLRARRPSQALADPPLSDDPQVEQDDLVSHLPAVSAIYYYYRVKVRVRQEERRTLLWDDLRGSLHCFAVNRCVDMYADALAGVQAHPRVAGSAS